MFKKLILPCVALAVTGCSVTKTLDMKSVETRNVEPMISAAVVPLTASIEVLRNADGSPIKAEKTIVFTAGKDFNSLTENDIAQFRNIALNRVAQQYGADLLVGTLTDVAYSFDDSRREEDETLTIRVSGYPAVYTDFKTVTRDDEWILDYYNQRQRPSSVVLPLRD